MSSRRSPTGLAGKGQQINTTLNSLSNALSTLDEGRGDFFAVLKSLAMFVNALHQDDQQFVALNKDLEQLTDNLTSSDQSAANAIRDTDSVAVHRAEIPDRESRRTDPRRQQPG